MPTYQQKVYTKTPVNKNIYEQVLYCYDSIIDLIEKARNNQIITERFKCIDKAIKITHLLSNDLKHQNQNSLQSALNLFYLSLVNKLYEIKFSNDENLYTETSKEIQALKEIWEEISENQALLINSNHSS